MAVEARHLNLFPQQTLHNRELIMNGTTTAQDIGGNVFASPIGYGLQFAPSSGTTETFIPVYGNETSPVKTAALKSDSGLTYAVPMSRKRSRDVINNNNNPHLLASFPRVVQNNQSTAIDSSCGGSFSFLGEDITSYIQQQQMEIDRFITQHTEKVRAEIEQRRKRYSWRMAATMEDNIMKKLRAKEEEIDKIGKLNWALEERVKSLCVENQLWKDLAQSNEATANDLRCNLEQLLIQQQQQQTAVEDDAQSCCGSNMEEMERRILAGGDCAASTGISCYIAPSLVDKKEGGNSSINKRNKMCRSCGKEESCVLLLPCRHLCLCTICGSSLHTCPICNSVKTASVHVNLYS